MPHRFVVFAVAFMMLIALALPALAADQKQPAARPCSEGNYRAFDFWVGEWDVSWPAQGGTPEGHGTNKVSRALDNCVIIENFSGEQSIPLRGMSISTFDAKSNHWKQTWVDNTGAYLDFVGDYKNDIMMLERDATNPEGKPIKQRMVYKNITEKGFDWSWERSEDGGHTWSTLWPIRYTKLAEAKKRQKSTDTKAWYKQW